MAVVAVNESIRVKGVVIARMLVWIGVVIIADAMIRSGVPDLFYEHGSPEVEWSNGQPIDSLTDTENALTLSIGGALIGIIVLRYALMLWRMRGSVRPFR